MLSKLRKKFHAVKYVYSIQIDRLEPWPCDDLPVCVTWKRGSKKSKRGETEPRHAANKEGSYPTVTTVQVQQAFDLSATLYSDSSKTKLTGPYMRKDCVFSVVQMTSDGSVGQARLGTAILNLAEIAACHEETIIEVDLSCDPKIKRAVGQPKLVLKCRAWYKGSSGPGSMSSSASGLSAMTGYTEETATLSDFSSLSNEPTKGKKPGVLTIEQEMSLEGFDGRAPPLDSIQEIVSPASSIKQEENISDQRVEESEAEKKSCPAEQHVLVAAGLSLPAITEENSTKDEAPRGVASEEIEDSAHSEENGENYTVDRQSQVVTGTVVKAHPKSDEHLVESLNSEIIMEPERSLKTENTLKNDSPAPELNVSHVAEIASLLDSYWTTGRLLYSNPQSEKSTVKNESADWWSMVMSLLTCMPIKANES